MPTRFPLAIFFPVWNRGDLFKACYDLLIGQLSGIEASIWIFDNGSEAATRELIASIKSPDHRVFKVCLPENMGIPFVANVFSQMLTQDCDYVGYRAPTHVMLADADVYFKRPILDLIHLLEADGDAGVISGHNSVEHETLLEYDRLLPDGSAIRVKEKSIERGACLVLRRELFADCVPFPHDTWGNVDWELMVRNAKSMAARQLKVLAVDAVVHLGLYDSTWHPFGVPADEKEIEEINSTLAIKGLFSEERKLRMQRYCREFNFSEPAISSS